MLTINVARFVCLTSDPNSPAERLKMSIGRLLSCLAVVMILLAVCGCGSPSAPSPSSLPDFQGQFAGSYVINNCNETGAFFSGFCIGSSSNAGGTYPLELSLVQNQTAISGTVILSRGGGSPIRGPFQGTIQPSGHLTGSATLEPLILFGTINRDITAWDTTISGNSLNGDFTLVHRSTTETGTMTVNASLLQMTRR
jgi:hypothetical protein